MLFQWTNNICCGRHCWCINIVMFVNGIFNWALNVAILNILFYITNPHSIISFFCVADVVVVVVVMPRGTFNHTHSIYNRCHTILWHNRSSQIILTEKELNVVLIEIAKCHSTLNKSSDDCCLSYLCGAMDVGVALKRKERAKFSH